MHSHRRLDDSWRIKSATISKDGDGKYYASVLFETEENVVRRVGTFDKKQVEMTLDEGTNFLALEKPVENASVEELPPTKVQL